MSKNIWGRSGCEREGGGRCNACCIAKACPYATDDGCSRYKSRPRNCAAFHCSNLDKTDRERLIDIAQQEGF